ncbi:MAG: DegT/DnrJ/EryC1/StrS family aminotransferase [Solirubrobacterales bacterium]
MTASPDSAPAALPLARPVIGDREQELVADVLSSGQLSLGPMLDRFERDFASWVGAGDAVAVSSGTAALHLGVRSLGWGAGDEVITSPLSFVASANCLLYEDVTPVFCDVDPTSANLDPQAAAAAVGERTAGILPIDIFGHPCAMPELEGVGARHGLGLLRDSCEALGARDADGTRVGARGELATFAFYANKQLATGEGGMVIPRDAAEAARLRSERNQGRAPDMGWLTHDRLGFNYRLSDVASAIGVAQLERLDDMLAARAGLAALYGRRLGDLDGLEIPHPPPSPAEHGWFVYVVRLPSGVGRDAVIDGLAAEGIASKEYLPCIHLYPHYRERFGFTGGEFPVAEDISARSLALPFAIGMGEDDVDRVATALGRIAGLPG